MSAFYQDRYRDRKILIGVFAGNVMVNNHLDGPFDHLPDNFIEGDALRQSILDAEPSLIGKIDNFGAFLDGNCRYVIAPYLYYHTAADLLVVHACATRKRMNARLYYGSMPADEAAQYSKFDIYSTRRSEAAGVLLPIRRLADSSRIHESATA
jgi:hypothetical protein